MKTRTALLLIVLGHVVLSCALHGGFDHDNDASAYGRISNELASGSFELTPHPFSNRFGLTVPTALVYLVRVDRYATTLWPLLASVGSVLLVHALVSRRFGARAGLLAAFFLALDTTQVRYSSRPLPDLVVSAFMLAALCAADQVRAGGPGSPREVLYGVLTALALSLGLLTKGTVVWSLPFYLGWMVLDLRRGRHARFWAAAAGTGVAAGAVFLLAYRLATGEALYRLGGIESTHNAAPWTFASSGADEVLRRITYEPLMFLLQTPGYGPLLCLCLPGLVGLALRLPFLPAGTRVLSSYLAVVLGSFWLGSTSPTVYNPLPIAERFLMPLLAPMAALAAVTVTALAADRAGGPAAGRGTALALMALGFLSASATLWRDGIKRALLYASFLPGLALLAGRGRARELGGPLAALCFALATVWAVVRPEPPRDDLASEARFLGAALRPGQLTLILSDAHSAYVLPMYLDAETRRHVRLLDWYRADPADGADVERVLAYVHEPRNAAYYMHWSGARPRFVDEPPPDWKRVAYERLLGPRGRIVYELDGVEELLDGR